MVFSDDVVLEVTADIIMFVLFSIVFVYLIRRDEKRTDLLYSKYDKLINNILDTITNQQTKYKDEIVSDIRDLSVVSSKVISGIDRIVEGVKGVEPEVTKVTRNAKDISNGVSQIVEDVASVTAQLELSVKSVEKLDLSVKEISSRLDKLIALFEYSKNIEVVKKQKSEQKEQKSEPKEQKEKKESNVKPTK